MLTDTDGLLIVVAGTEWGAFGEMTLRNKMLYKRLVRKGGINESVKDGEYIYNIKRVGLHFEESLLPVE